MPSSFKDLVVWQRSLKLCAEVYNLTANFPADERFGLTNQLHRASVSIASNIAEGYGRSTTGEYVQFLGHARGSVSEVQTRLQISAMLRFGPEEIRESAVRLSEEVSKMLIAMMVKLRGRTEVAR